MANKRKQKKARVPRQQTVYDLLKGQKYDDEDIDIYMDENYSDKDSLKKQIKKMDAWFK